MKSPRTIILALLALSMALLAAVGYMAYLLKISPDAIRYVTRPVQVTNTVRQIAVRKVNATNLLAALVNRPANWGALESTNYVVYINNLRAFGTPEETIRDIILTDIAKTYSRRKAEVRAQGGGYRWWQTSETGEVDEEADPALKERLDAIDAEQHALVQELLGVDFDTELARYWGGDDYENRLYGFLTEDKRGRVSELQERFDELERQIYDGSKGFLLDKDEEALRQLQKQREEELAQVLTPEELEEFHLRNSPTAANLRAQLHGFNPSQEEFRRLFRLQKTFDDRFNNGFDVTDPAQANVQAASQEQAQQALNEEMRRALGSQRYAEYERQQDPDYRAMQQFQERFQTSPALANRVYDMKTEAERQKLRVESDPNITPEQRAQALGAIAQETERSVVQLMGGQNSELWQAYQRTGSQWIRGLSDSDFVVQSDFDSQPPVVAPAPVPRLFPFIPQQPPLPVRQ
jgi:hypothetical protein